MHVDPHAPLFIVLNPRSGKHAAGDARAAIEEVLRSAGRAYDIRQADDPRKLAETARQAVVDAKARGGVVVVAGGDGTINTVAQAVLGSGCAFGVLPQGTFNYFGRAHGIAADAGPATRALLDAVPQAVQVGTVNGKVFLVNASVGLYPQVLEDREAYKRAYGRSRLVAVWSAMVTLCTAHRPLRLRLQGTGGGPGSAAGAAAGAGAGAAAAAGAGAGAGAGAAADSDAAAAAPALRSVRTPTLFVGNNPLQLQQTGLPGVATLQQGALVAITLKPVGTLKLLWLMLRGAFGTLGQADDVHSFGFTGLSVQPAPPLGTRKVKVATDGEIHWLRAPLLFRVSPEPLWLMKAPGDASGGHGATGRASEAAA